MKRILILLVLLCFFKGICFAHSSYENKRPLIGGDTTTKLLDIAVASNPWLKGMDYIPTFTLYNGTLFLVNKNKLVQINLKTGAISLNKPVTDFLKTLPEGPSAVSQLRVMANEYYLIVWNNLYRIAASGEATKIYENYSALQGINLSKDKFIVALNDTVALINKNGKRLNEWIFPYRASSGFCNGEKGIYYTANSEDSLLEFQSMGETDLTVNRYPPLAELHSIKDPWLSFVSEKYLIAFNYTKRNAIYVIKKGLNKNELYKTIAVKGANLTPTQQQVMDEEGTPNLKIDYSDEVYYILSIIKGKLKVLSFKV